VAASTKNTVIRAACRDLSDIAVDVSFGTDSRSRFLPC
jgi:hypothetical protein